MTLNSSFGPMIGLLTRREWLTASACLLLFAALAVFQLAPRLCRDLETSAAHVIARLDQSAGGARFDRVHIAFDGRRPLVSGCVRNEADARSLLRSLAEDLRTPGNSFNPVRRVSTRDSLSIRPLDPGWLAAAIRGFDAEIIGVSASEKERAALESSLRQRWPVWRGNIRFAIQVDPRRFDESPAWLASVRALPSPEARGSASARFLAARIGRAWTAAPLESPSPDPPPSSLASLGITSSEWRDRLLPRIQSVHAHHQQETAWEAEQRRLDSLPPAHVFIGRRDNLLLLRGEVFDIEAKRAVIAAVIAAFPGHRILDDLRSAGLRRPRPGLAPLHPEVLLDSSDASGGKLFALGLPAKNWIPLDWAVARDARPWAGLLPDGLDPSSLLEDSALVIDWLQGSNAGIPALPPPPQPPFLTLAVCQDRVFLGGRLAEASLHAQIIAAVKRAYPSGFTFNDHIIVSGSVAASDSVQHTVQSIPHPGSAECLFALARPGQTWQVLPPASAAGLGSLPPDALIQDLPPSTVASALEPALEEARALGLPFPNPPSRAKDNPGDKP
jgi:hypothetical protein